MEDPHIVVQVICVFTSASNPNSSYGVKIWGYIDFGQGCVSTSAALSHIWLANFQKTAPIMAHIMAPIMKIFSKFFGGGYYTRAALIRVRKLIQRIR